MAETMPVHSTETRIFRSTLTGATVTFDLIEEQGKVDFATGVGVFSSWPASYAMGYMRSNGGFEHWTEELN